MDKKHSPVSNSAGERKPQSVKAEQPCTLRSSNYTCVSPDTCLTTPHSKPTDSVRDAAEQAEEYSVVSKLSELTISSQPEPSRVISNSLTNPRSKSNGLAVHEHFGSGQRMSNMANTSKDSTSDTQAASRRSITQIMAENNHQSRYMKISNIDRQHWPETFKLFFCKENGRDFSHTFKSRYDPDGCHIIVCLCFNDIRDADHVLPKTVAFKLAWRTAFVTQQEFAAFTDTLTPAHLTNTPFDDGRLTITATFSGRPEQYSSHDPEDIVREVLHAYGPLHSFSTGQRTTYPNVQYYVEYCKISDAREVIASMTESHPDVASDLWTLVAKSISKTVCLNEALSTDQARIASSPSFDHAHVREAFHTSPTGRSVWRVDSRGNQITVQPTRVIPQVHLPAMSTEFQVMPNYYDQGRMSLFQTPHTTPTRGMQPPTTPRYREYGSPEDLSMMDSTPKLSQNVNVNSLDQGLEVRTTLMLRNIPNRMNLWAVKKILDETSFGRYDFFYLRIDFARNANVGYGFVNFMNGWDLAKFVRAHEGQPWHVGNARTCGVSFATIQGLDCLIEKFRNSAVMEEAPDFRPKIFYTEDDAPDATLVGTERAFPPPNNQSKKQRSRDNASHLGLFTPQSNHQVRTQARHSQYDRGTPAQLQEDLLYNPVVQPAFHTPTANNYMLSERSPGSFLPASIASPFHFSFNGPSSISSSSTYLSSPTTDCSMGSPVTHQMGSGKASGRLGILPVPTTPTNQTGRYRSSNGYYARPAQFATQPHHHGLASPASTSFASVSNKWNSVRSPPTWQLYAHQSTSPSEPL